MLMMVEVETPRDDELVTLKEAAADYGLSIPTLRQHINLRRMPSWRRGTRLLIRRSDAEALRDRLRELRRNG